MSEELTLKQREQTRLAVMGLMDRGSCTVVEAAAVLGVSERQVWRIRSAYRQEGAAGLVHGNRGRRSTRRVEQSTRARIVELAKSDDYQGCNQVLLTELLSEREDLRLARTTVRQILAEAGIHSPRRQRRRRHHRQRRERAAAVGQLLQMDASPHAWLERRGPRLCLHAAIDDATGQIHGATFREQEDTAGYLTVLKQVAQEHGVPLAVYHDRHTIFGSSKAVSIEDQLAGKRRIPSHVERALQELGIESIKARSPQAKGRIERLFGTLQDRLVIALRLANVASAGDANTLLPAFIEAFNRRFGVPPANSCSSYRRWPEELVTDEVFCFKYQRVVGADNTLRLDGHRIQLLPGDRRLSYAKCRAEVHERLDGKIEVFYKRQCLPITDAPPEAPVLRGRPGTRGSAEPISGGRGFGDGQPGPTKRNQPSPITKTTTQPNRRQAPWVPPPDHPWRKFKLNGH